MRLTAREVDAIKAAAAAAFGAEAVVRLFGSRLDDTRRGGDIDLHVELADEPSPHGSAAFRRLLDRTVGEREYDILVSVAGRPSSSVEQRAISEGVVL